MKHLLSCATQSNAARTTVIGGILLLFCGLTALAAKKTRKKSKQRRNATS